MSISLGDVCYIEKYNVKVIVYEVFKYGVSRIAYVSDNKEFFTTGRHLWINDNEFVVCGANCSICNELLTPTGENKVDIVNQIENHFENDFFNHRRRNKYERAIKSKSHWIKQRVLGQFGCYPEGYRKFLGKAFWSMGRIGTLEIGAVMNKYENAY